MAALTWANESDEIIALACCGSYARDNPRPDSDLDLCIFVHDLQRLLDNRDWVARFGESISMQEEDWGLVKSLRVFFSTGIEIEFGFIPPSWTSTSPVDPGTRSVVSDGFKILYDPTGMLTALLDAVQHPADGQ